MAQIKIKLYGDKTLIKTFDQSDLIGYNLTTEISNEPLVPTFDLYPSSGTLVIQDKDETLYNLAVNGGLEYNEYVVELYINNDTTFVYKNIATDRPNYSATEKTLTLSLSDYLDRATTETYKGYDYPLESKNLYEIYTSVLCDYLGLNFEDKAVEIGEFYNNIDYNGSLTIKDYLETITVPYPYMQQDTYRNTFKKIMTAAMLAMTWTSAEYPTLVSLTGSEQNSNIAAITTDRVIERFNPTVVLPNKYNSIDIDCKQAIVEYHSNETCYTVENLSKGFTNTATWDVDKKSAIVLLNNYENLTFEVWGYYKEITVEQGRITKDGEYVDTGTIHIYNYDYDNVGSGIIEIQKYQDGNKRAITSLVVDEANNRPSYGVTCLVRTTKQKGTFKAKRHGAQGLYLYFDKENFFPQSEESVSERTVANYALSNTIKDSTFTGLGTTIEASLTFYVTENTHDISYSQGSDELKSRYIDRTKMFAGYTYYEYFTGTEDNNSFRVTYQGEEEIEIDGWRYKHEIIPISLSITYYGDFSQIVFEDKSYKEKRTTSSNVVNNCSIYNGGELLQYTDAELDKTNNKTIPEKVAETTLDNYRNGLQVATINCIGWDYYAFKTSGNDTSGYIDDYLSHVYNKSTQAVTAPLFAVGELVVPCKDSVKGIPIVRKGKNIPIFQVLKANITISQGGSITQALTIRELPCDYQIDPLSIRVSNYNCTLPASNPKTFDGSAPIQILFTPLSGYKSPDTVQVSGCTYTYSKDEIVVDQYGSRKGVVNLIKPYANATEIKIVIYCIPG